MARHGSAASASCPSPPVSQHTPKSRSELRSKPHPGLWNTNSDHLAKWQAASTRETNVLPSLMQACPSHASPHPATQLHGDRRPMFCTASSWGPTAVVTDFGPARGSSGRTGPGEAGSVFREMRPIWMMRFQGLLPVGYFPATKVSCLFLDKPSSDHPRTKQTWLTSWPADKQIGLLRKNGRRARGGKNFQSNILSNALLLHMPWHLACIPNTTSCLVRRRCCKFAGFSAGNPVSKHARQSRGPASKQQREILPCCIIGLGNGLASSSTGLAVIGSNAPRGWHQQFEPVSWTAQCHGEPRSTIGQPWTASSKQKTQGTRTG